MSDEFERIKEQALKLSDDERAEFALFLIESLTPQPKNPQDVETA
jgi:hypothetical protein